jgi:hypothetical protein
VTFGERFSASAWEVLGVDSWEKVYACFGEQSVPASTVLSWRKAKNAPTKDENRQALRCLGFDPDTGSSLGNASDARAPEPLAFGLVSETDADEDLARRVGRAPWSWRLLPGPGIDPIYARRLDRVDAWAARELADDDTPFESRRDFVVEVQRVTRMWRAAWTEYERDDASWAGRFVSRAWPAEDHVRAHGALPEPTASAAAALVAFAVGEPATLASAWRALAASGTETRAELARALLAWWVAAADWTCRADGALVDAFVARARPADWPMPLAEVDDETGEAWPNEDEWSRRGQAAAVLWLAWPIVADAGLATRATEPMPFALSAAYDGVARAAVAAIDDGCDSLRTAVVNVLPRPADLVELVHGSGAIRSAA